MARHENPERPNRNTFICGTSGTGKSNVTRQLIKRAKIARLVAWDINKDHDVKHRVYSLADFIDYLELNGHKARFSVAYSGPSTPDVFELWCAAVFAILDGDKLTGVICEELAAVTNPGKAKLHLATLMNQGRKYGMVFWGVSQKPQEVSSTVYDQCNYFYVGRLKRLGAKRIYDETDLHPDGIRQLPDLHFCYLTPEFKGDQTADQLAVAFKFIPPKAIKKKTPTPKG